ncbi:spore germination protein [Cohnella rhizosphaerae]|uniref:Spore germination protein n=2 Tax=Cohnella rhizosphaerae TaxID=1457232 RepID=A0A9X4QY33_9BACL|nr:spore germination protein [Cohnella rhizosphaerae]MDG0814227.1 spore germination protein [Cohnella rhizosphaerae]
MLQSAEDYYQPYIAASWIRWIRFVFFADLAPAALVLYCDYDVSSGDDSL